MTLSAQLFALEHTLLIQAVRTYRTRQQAAHSLGISLRTLFYKLARHKLSTGDPRAPTRKGWSREAVRRYAAAVGWPPPRRK